jgi:hypothetical protein
MKRKIYVVALVLAVLWGNGAAWADEDFYVIAGSGAVGTKITTLPYTINTSGFYFLGGNLTGKGNGITITASNVTLDLMGFAIAGGNTGSGIGLSGGPDNVVIRNGTIRNFQNGVNGQITPSVPSNNSRMINVRINHCSTYGATFDGKSHMVKNCTFTNNGTGLNMSAGTISGCMACDNTSAGIILAGPGNVTGNTANNNSNYNFYLGIIETKTPMLVDGNSANGLPHNYFITPGSTGVVMGTNAGTP